MKPWLVLYPVFFLLTAALAEGSRDPAEFFSRIWSPYCKGVSLLECPSGQAEDLRKEIRARINAGEQIDTIFNEINQKHDNKLRMEPGRHGRESLAYWIPWISVFIAGIFVALFWKFRKKRALIPAKKTDGLSPVQNQKILEDLKARS